MEAEVSKGAEGVPAMTPKWIDFTVASTQVTYSLRYVDYDNGLREWFAGDLYALLLGVREEGEKRNEILDRLQSLPPEHRHVAWVLEHTAPPRKVKVVTIRHSTLYQILVQHIDTTQGAEAQGLMSYLCQSSYFAPTPPQHLQDFHLVQHPETATEIGEFLKPPPILKVNAKFKELYSDNKLVCSVSLLKFCEATSTILRADQELEGVLSATVDSNGEAKFPSLKITGTNTPGEANIPSLQRAEGPQYGIYCLEFQLKTEGEADSAAPLSDAKTAENVVSKEIVRTLDICIRKWPKKRKREDEEPALQSTETPTLLADKGIATSKKMKEEYPSFPPSSSLDTHSQQEAINYFSEQHQQQVSYAIPGQRGAEAPGIALGRAVVQQSSDGFTQMQTPPTSTSSATSSTSSSIIYPQTDTVSASGQPPAEELVGEQTQLAWQQLTPQQQQMHTSQFVSRFSEQYLNPPMGQAPASLSSLSSAPITSAQRPSLGVGSTAKEETASADNGSQTPAGLLPELPPSQQTATRKRVQKDSATDPEASAEEPTSDEAAGLAPGHEGRIDITKLLTLPQNEAAAKLKMSNATFSKRFRQANDNKRWPYRALQVIEKQLKEAKAKEQKATIQTLEEKKRALLVPAYIFVRK
ncbi:hypothetical protein QOT17_000086 [Balamuthia mandrillaris]